MASVESVSLKVPVSSAARAAMESLGYLNLSEADALYLISYLMRRFEIPGVELSPEEEKKDA